MLSRSPKKNDKNTIQKARSNNDLEVLKMILDDHPELKTKVIRCIKENLQKNGGKKLNK